MIGQADGPLVIMLILFIIFVITFLKTLSIMKKYNKRKQRGGHRKSGKKKTTVFSLIKSLASGFKYYVCCCGRFCSDPADSGNNTTMASTSTSSTRSIMSTIFCCSRFNTRPLSDDEEEGVKTTTSLTAESKKDGKYRVDEDDDEEEFANVEVLNRDPNQVQCSTKMSDMFKCTCFDTCLGGYCQTCVDRIGQINFLDYMRFFGEQLEHFIQERFRRMGKFCATYPKLVLFTGLAFCAVLCLGYFNFRIEKDPVKLWSSDSSKARQNKKYFDENFGPFYRITQLIIEPKPEVPFILFNSTTTGVDYNITALRSNVLMETFRLYQRINHIVADVELPGEKDNFQHVTLDDICFQPLHPDNKNCAIQSLFQYWQNDEEKFMSSMTSTESLEHLEHLDNCMKNPFDQMCLSTYGAPTQPFMVVGSYNTSSKQQNKTESADSVMEKYLNAGALVITYVLKNYRENENVNEIKKAMAWEGEVLALLKNYSSHIISVYYTTERSIEDEIERESTADIKIIAISYIVMFFYLTLTLGKYSSLNVRVIMLETKIFLGLAGVVLVLLSVFSSGGFFTYLGVPATLITLEVIPFLLLAVGVDNIYVMVQTYQNDERRPGESIDDQIARIVGKVGPSMLLTGTTQSVAFLISAMTPMPGVRAFSLYASLAIMINFVMQITCFVVLLTLDAKREHSQRLDLCCFIKLGQDGGPDSSNYPEEIGHYIKPQKSYLHK